MHAALESGFDKLCGVGGWTVVSSALGKDGCQRHGDGADVHEEE